MEHEMTCPVCGKMFIAKSWNTKYCSNSCRVWAFRHNANSAAEKEAEAKRNRDLFRQKQAEREQERKAQKEREAAAADGDAFSKMMLADKFSLEYWTAFQQMEQEYASASGRESKCEVNGISVNDDQFPLKVMLTIEELGNIKTDMEG